MFNPGIRNMADAIERVKGASASDVFNSVICSVRTYMKEIGMGSEDLMALERRAYYQRNEYSEKDTQERMEEAKARVIAFLEELMDNHQDEELLVRVLERK